MIRESQSERDTIRAGEFRENSKQTKSKASSKQQAACIMHYAAHSKIHKRKSIQVGFFFFFFNYVSSLCVCVYIYMLLQPAPIHEVCKYCIPNYSLFNLTREPNFFPLSQYFQFSYSISTNIMDVDLLGRSSSSSKYECLLFDMDDTLYPLSSGLNLACRKNIEEFMLHQLHIDESEVPRMCLDLYREYGTTMAGLKALGYEFDNDEFHALVHGRLPYDALKPDPLLRNLLLSMPQRKIIFTNADKAHATQVLNRMGLEDCFEGVICFETLNPPPNTPLDCADAPEANPTVLPHSTTSSKILCKPSIEAFHAAIRIASLDPNKTIFFDDSARNIASGKAAGLHTVIVGSSVVVAGADHALRSIHNIKEALAEIWEGDAEEAKQVVLVDQVIQSTAVETAVLA